MEEADFLESFGEFSTLSFLVTVPFLPLEGLGLHSADQVFK